jgi:hypothetical protein
MASVLVHRDVVLYSLPGGARLIPESLRPRTGLPHRSFSGGMCAGAQRSDRWPAPAQLPLSPDVASVARDQGSHALSRRIRDNRQSFVGVGSPQLRHRNPRLRHEGRREFYRPCRPRLVCGLSEEGFWQPNSAGKWHAFSGPPSGGADRYRRRQNFLGASASSRAICIRAYPPGNICIRTAAKRHRRRTLVLSLRGSPPDRAELRTIDRRPSNHAPDHRHKCVGQEDHRWKASRGATEAVAAAIQVADHWRKVTPSFFQAIERGLPSPLYWLASSERLLLAACGAAESNGGSS